MFPLNSSGQLGKLAKVCVTFFFLFDINPPEPLHHPSVSNSYYCFMPFYYFFFKSRQAHSPLLPDQLEPVLFASYIFQEQFSVFPNVNRKTFLQHALHGQMHRSHACRPLCLLVGRLQTSFDWKSLWWLICKDLMTSKAAHAQWM